MRDKEKLLKMFDTLENSISEVEKIGEYEDCDLDQEVEKIYKNLESLSVDVWGLLCNRGWVDEGETSLWKKKNILKIRKKA